MALSVLSALELDQRSIHNKLTLIEENDTSDASFVVSLFLEQALKKNHKIVIVLFHNSIGHYQAIAQKLGYDLLERQEQGEVFMYDFLKIILDGISADGSLPDESIMKTLFIEVKHKLTELGRMSDITLIIDNVGNLVLLGFLLKTIVFFMHYCRTLLYDFKNLSITCLTHFFADNDDFRIFMEGLRYVSYMSVVLEDLRNGRTPEITGKLTVKWRTEDSMQWREPIEYHYQLLDKNVNIFLPGMRNM